MWRAVVFCRPFWAAYKADKHCLPCCTLLVWQIYPTRWGQQQHGSPAAARRCNSTTGLTSPVYRPPCFFCRISYRIISMTLCPLCPYVDASHVHRLSSNYNLQYFPFLLIFNFNPPINNSSFFTLIMHITQHHKFVYESTEVYMPFHYVITDDCPHLKDKGLRGCSDKPDQTRPHM